MWLMAFLGGLMVGCMASMPLGPTAILCIQRNLSKGMPSGIVTGLGIATSDTLYASIAFFSLSLAVKGGTLSAYFSTRMLRNA